MNHAIKTGRSTPHPYHYYTLPVLFPLLLGIADTGYLVWSHYKNYTDLTFNSFCALTRSINCDTVSQSPWSILCGLPLAYWGFFAYALFLLLFLATLRRTNGSKQIWPLLFLLGLVYAIAAVAFGYISATEIKAHCILCLASHSICFALLFSSWIILRRFCPIPFSTALKGGVRYILTHLPLKIGLSTLFLGFLCIKIYLPSYWQYTLPPITANIPSGQTEVGHPWIGAEDPKITIHEYADYQCFQCSKMHLFLRRLIAEKPGKIKLVHHHYPMDHEFNNIIVPEPFHIGSGKLAMIGIYAASKNKFWDMNDALYDIGRGKQAFSTKALADRTGFLTGELSAAIQHPQIREALLYDIRQGMKLGITGTPSYVIDGKVYQGAIPADILREIMR